MRKRPARPVSSSSWSSRESWRSPRRPVARKGADGSAVDRPIKRHVPPHAQRRKRIGAFRCLARIVAAHVRRPLRKRVVPRLADVGVVIAGNDGDAFRRPKLPEPGGRLPEFLRQPDMREIAGHGDVIETFRVEVGAKRIEHVASGARGGAACATKGSRGSACRAARAGARLRARTGADPTSARARTRHSALRARHVRRHIGGRGRVRKCALVRVDRELHGTHPVSI